MVEAIYLCPAGPSEACTWEGRSEEIRQHFHSKHHDLVLTTNNFTVNVSTSAVQNRLLFLKGDVYLVQTKVSVSDGKLVLKVRYLGTPEQAISFVYTVNIRAGNYAFKWLPDENCQVIYTKDGGVEVDLQMIRLTCGNVNLEYVVCVLNINEREEHLSVADNKNFSLTPLRRRKELTRTSSSEKSFTRNTKNRNSFLQNFFYEDNSADSNSIYSLYLEDTIFDNNPELACATCCTEMCPPIYLCMNGHSVCGSCKNEKCRSCNQHILDIRNTDLEDISIKKQHSCKYASHGCGERGNCNEIRKHEVNCRFCVYKCCLCPQEGKFAEIKSHFKLLHSSVKIYETLRSKFPKNTSFVVISSEYGIFYCVSSVVSGSIEWSVTFCGPKERWFSCDLKIKGKKEEVTYSFRRNVNVYTLSLSQADLKTAGVKDKYAVLEISQ